MSAPKYDLLRLIHSTDNDRELLLSTIMRLETSVVTVSRTRQIIENVLGGGEDRSGEEGSKYAH